MFGTWHLVRYGSDRDTTAPIDGSQVSLVVGRPIPFAGSLGCNSYIIHFEADGSGGLEVATFWTTHKVCSEPGIMAQEDVGSLLSRAVSFERTDEDLEVTTDTGDVLIWSR